MKTALITGATVNTGLGIAKKFASEGWRVVITSRREDAIPQAVEEIKHLYPECEVMAYQLDMLNTDNSVNQVGISAMFESLDDKGIKVDALILNAANLGIKQRIFENPLFDFQNVINTNVVANYFIAEEAAKRMKSSGGSITFINSNTAYRAIPDRIAYCTSKSAQLGMMRAMALDLGRYNIRVNAVLPGMIKTDRWESNYNNCKEAPSNYTPLRDIAEFSDIADAVWYFAAHARNTTGAELTVDGGNMIQLYPIIDN